MKDYEGKVIGAMLLSTDSVRTAKEMLSQNDFSNETYRHIFKAIIELFEDHKPHDFKNILDLLKVKGVAEETCSLATLRELICSAPKNEDVWDYYDIVSEKAELRRLKNIS